MTTREDEKWKDPPRVSIYLPSQRLKQAAMGGGGWGSKDVKNIKVSTQGL